MLSQMHVGRQMAEQKADAVMNGLGLDRMVIIQDQDKLRFNGSQFIEQRHQDRLNGPVQWASSGGQTGGLVKIGLIGQLLEDEIGHICPPDFKL
ncbi:hypothetical protein IQ254_30075 [Nodosilinea sp. LEGE 07088]|nr:hypothetical protein [Nodosilinea sp. LEGE 07088]MBE9141392.1 hypothetical protein [Nodosilinea sp. LEGE 07088]